MPSWVGPEQLVLCSSYSGNTEETLAAYDDALERGASRLVATTGGGLAQRARRDGVPVIPLPGGFQPRAAVGYGLVSALEAAALAGAAPSLRVGDRGGRRARRGARGRVGPGRRRGERGEDARAAAARDGAGDRRRRAHRAGRLPLEVPGQRERRRCPRSRARCPSSTTTRSSAGPARTASARSPPSSSRTPARTRATCCAAELTAAEAAGGRPRRRARHRPRRVAPRAPRRARAARRPRLALPRRARGHRSGRHRADRQVEEGSERANVAEASGDEELVSPGRRNFADLGYVTPCPRLKAPVRRPRPAPRRSPR